MVDVATAPAHQSLLDYVRNDAQLRGTKEGCASGDCGACTVIVRELDGSKPRTVNSCITPLGAALGKQVITVEGVGTPEQPHPVQQAMVDEHGSQCGFCTPGFVVSLVATQLREASHSSGETDPAEPGRIQAVESISGNLCRCTGYRPIIATALGAASQAIPAAKSATDIKPSPHTAEARSYQRPKSLARLLESLDANGHTRTLGNNGGDASKPWLLAGATDGFLEVTQRYLDPSQIVDLTEIDELKGITSNPDGSVTIGAAATHEETLRYFSQASNNNPTIVDVLKRFGSPQIRARGTLGGNIANASPIADWPPMLMALSADLILVNTRGVERDLPIDQFYLGYKSTVLRSDELIKAVRIPASIDTRRLHARKISKRFEDDISSTLGAIYLVQENRLITAARIAYGGVAATPLRCTATESVLLGKELTPKLIEQAIAALAEEISPISDVRASANYRREASKAILQGALETPGTEKMEDTRGARA